MAITFAPSVDETPVAPTNNLKSCAAVSSSSDVKTLLAAFLRNQAQIEAHKAGVPVVVDGQTLSIADIVSAARYASTVALSSDPTIRARVAKSRNVIEGKIQAGHSVYGLSTGLFSTSHYKPFTQYPTFIIKGFGGSADTRTNTPLVLGKSLLQHQNAAIFPQKTTPLDVLPISGDPITATTMPEAWVKAAILIRMNSLIRGHSGVRWEFIEALQQLLSENITPVVPMRGSISASGGKYL